MKEAIEFHRWMMKNDTIENADKYFHWSDEDMYNEFLRVKPRDDIEAEKEKY